MGQNTDTAIWIRLGSDYITLMSFKMLITLRLDDYSTADLVRNMSDHTPNINQS